MNCLIYIWKNVVDKPLKFIFNVLLVMVAVCLVDLLLLINKQFDQHLGRSSENINMILCAKGSPLQSVLCNILHIDAPTGNIRISDIKPFLNPNHPLILKSFPIALGDSYKSYRIIGSTLSYLEWNNLILKEGRWFKNNFEIIIGSSLAIKEKIKLNDTIFSNHGLTNSELNTHHDHGLIVVGILNEKKNIFDKLIYTPISTYWKEHDHNLSEIDSTDSLSSKNDLAIHNEDLLNSDREISSVLIKFRGNNIQTLNFARNINENSKLMAVNPAIEISRLYSITNSASDLLYWIAIVLGLLSCIAIFINLTQALDERILEMAILRIGGATPILLFILLLLEGILIVVLGTLLGLSLAHLFLQYASSVFALGDKYGIYGNYFCKEEIMLIAVSFVCGIIASIYPALKAYTRDIASVISH